ncbi:MAG: EVE domain-containing protein [Staphylococcus epidermidis]|nr:EVE domain-containing protein [Staphylococcus epidermidis]
MTEEINYFWLNCGYNRWNHNEPLVGQTALFESGAHFNPTQGYRAFKKAKAGDQVIFYQVQTDSGLLGIGEIISVQSGAQNKIRVEFKFKETLKPLTTDYLKRSETLDFRMSNMRETLFNQIRESEFELIVSLGKGKSKIPRYFLLAETEAFEPGKNYTIFTHTFNGIKRNGYHFYTQLEVGDNIIIYNKYQNQSVIGIGEVSKHIHEKPPIPGRTNSTAIEIFYEKDIKPISLGHLNKHPFETVKKAELSTQNAEDDSLKPFVLLVVEQKGEGLKAAEELLQKTNANPVITSGHPDFTEDMLYGKYLPNESGALYYREGFITHLMPKKDKSYLVIDNFNRIDVDIFQTYINVLEGYEVTLPRYNKDGSMIKWSKNKDSFYHFNPNWHIVGITYDSIEKIKQKYSSQFLKYTRIVKVNHD